MDRNEWINKLREIPHFDSRGIVQEKQLFDLDNKFIYILKKYYTQIVKEEKYIYKEINRCIFPNYHFLTNLNFIPFFGLNWDGHFSKFSPLPWWKNFQELDCTKLIDFFLMKKESRLVSFLTALYESVGESFNSNYLGYLYVRSEVHFFAKKAGRIDLAFYEGDKLICIIEAKFNAALNNEMSVYDKYVEEKSSKKTGCLKIILGKKYIKYKGWVFCSWEVLLRNWEKYIKNNEDFDCNFSCFRRSLWEKVNER